MSDASNGEIVDALWRAATAPPPPPITPGPTYQGNGSSPVDLAMAAFMEAANADLPATNAKLAALHAGRQNAAADALAELLEKELLANETPPDDPN